MRARGACRSSAWLTRPLTSLLIGPLQAPWSAVIGCSGSVAHRALDRAGSWSASVFKTEAAA